jgi:hypothetical protein
MTSLSRPRGALNKNVPTANPAATKPINKRDACAWLRRNKGRPGRIAPKPVHVTNEATQTTVN